MNNPSEMRSPLLDFLDSFLQERNIRWILITGLAILFGSSVMLVTTHWHEAGPVWKYLVFLGYTSALFGCGQYLCPRLGLTRTATVLLALVALLLPVTFVAWRWTWPGIDGDAVAEITSAALLLVHTAIAFFAGRQTIRYLLRGDQSTFLASYLLLCLAGPVLPDCPPALYLPASVALWGVFTIGAVKVNRHVFWLTEEMQWPRVFGFFPIVLLASQFVGLIGFCVAPHVSFGWLGPICVLVALTILLTADAVARVYEQRTGGLVWPWPLPIALPIVVGLLTCAAGVALASVDFALVRDGRALVIAAGLAAVVIERVARRTNRTVFVHAALILATVAYNFLPSFALETARSVVAQSAHAVQEQRLPLAFYGITYLPLISVLLVTGVIARRRGNLLWARPIEQYLAIVCWALLALGLTHVKAVASVGLAMTVAFALHERLFRSRLAGLGAIAAWLATCAGAVPFASQVLEIDLPRFAPFLAMSVAAAALSIVATLRRRAGLVEHNDHDAVSLTVSMGTAVAFPIVVLFDAVTAALHQNTVALLPEVELATWAAGLAIAGLMLRHSFRWRDGTISTATILYLQVVSVLVALQCEVPLAQLLPLISISLSAQWVVSRILKTRPRSTVAQIFASPLERTLIVEHAAVLTLGWLPLFGLNLAGVLPWADGALTWIGAAAAIAWAFHQASQYRHSFTALLGMLATQGLVCTIFMNLAGPIGAPWLAVVCGATALFAVPIAEALRTAARSQLDTDAASISAATALERPLVGLMLVNFLILVGCSINQLTTEALVGQAVAAAGLVWFAWRSSSPMVRATTAALLSWLVVLLPAHFVHTSAHTLWQLRLHELSELCFPVGLLAAVLCAAWTIFGRRDNEDTRLFADLQRVAFGLVTIAAGFAALDARDPTFVQMALSISALLVLAVAQAYEAWRDQQEARVWTAIALAVATLVYVAHWELIHVGGQFAMFCVVGAGVTAWSLGTWLAKSDRVRIFSRPLSQIGYLLPAVNLPIALYREFLLADAHWVGLPMLALVASGAFYFWRGLEERRSALIVLAGVIANTALFLVWHELHLTNPQCYMIPLGTTIVLLTELLRRETPEALRDPLRYLGAIVILVSPVFDMFDGSWLPFFTLMIASVLVLLAAIGMRVRALMYASAGFLVADLAGMIVRGCVDHPQLLWMAGLGVGTAVVVTGAICEMKRETLLARVRLLSATLETWN